MKQNKSRFSNKITPLLLFIFVLLLPTQLGKHFFFDFSYVSGVRIDYLSLVLYLTDIIALMLIALHWGIISAWVKKNHILLLCFLGLALLTISLSQIPVLGFYSLMKIMEALCVYIIFSKTNLSLKYIVVAFTIGAAVELFLAALQLYSRGSLQGIFYFLGERAFSISSPGIATAYISNIQFIRPYGTFPHPNSMGGFYLLIYFLALSMKLPRSFLLLLFSAFLIFLSFSKLAISVFVLFNILFFLSQKKELCRICMISRITSFVALLLFLPHIHSDPLTLEKRLLLFSNSITIIKEHLLFGVGLGQYLIAQAHIPNPYPYFFLQPVHNIFLLFLAQTGILLTGFVAWVLYKSFRPFLHFEPFLFCIGVIILTGFFDHYWLTLQQNMLLLAMTLGFLKKEAQSAIVKS